MTKKPLFQKRHYDALAGMVKKMLVESSFTAAQCVTLAWYLIYLFEEDNHAFDRIRFLKACCVS